MRVAKRKNQQQEAAGEDAFLDIVANIVGILILLVMVVGVRAARRPKADASAAQQAAAAASREAAEQAVERVVTQTRDVRALAARAVEARRQAAIQDGARLQLATFVAAAEKELADERSKLADQERQDYDLRVQLTAAHRRLDELTRAQAAQLSVETEVETVENLPTPLARSVDGDEVHLRLSEGRVAVIPLRELLELRRDDVRNNRWRLANRDQAFATIGPVGGFRMRYGVQKTAYSGAQGSGHIYSYAGWRLIPGEGQLTETVEQAISEGSALRLALAEYPPRRTTVTVWAYPDSFNEFRELKQTLYELGFATAGRPLPAGEPIGGSPRGVRSSAQ